MINERFAQNVTEHVIKGKTKGNAKLKERYHNSCLSIALSTNKQTGPTQTRWDWHADSNVRGCYTFLYSDVRGHLYISMSNEWEGKGYSNTSETNFPLPVQRFK